MSGNINSTSHTVGSPGSSICPVCQGIGDLKSPRGVSVKLPDNHYSRKRYAYIYMHYPNTGLLCHSEEAGCEMCKLLREELESQCWIARGKGFDEANTACSPAPGNTSTCPESIIHAAEIDDDVSIVTDLAELTRPESLRKTWDFKHVESRRIALRLFSDEEAGPRGSPTPFNIEVFDLGHNFRSNIPGFKQSCESMFHHDIMVLLGDTNTKQTHLIRTWITRLAVISCRILTSIS